MGVVPPFDSEVKSTIQYVCSVAVMVVVVILRAVAVIRKTFRTSSKLRGCYDANS